MHDTQTHEQHDGAEPFAGYLPHVRAFARTLAAPARPFAVAWLNCGAWGHPLHAALLDALHAEAENDGAGIEIDEVHSAFALLQCTAHDPHPAAQEANSARLRLIAPTPGAVQHANAAAGVVQSVTELVTCAPGIH